METKIAPFKQLVLILAVALVVSSHPALAQDENQLLLKDYRPVSIYKIPITRVNKALFPVIDMHSHDYAKTDQENRPVGKKHGCLRY